MTRRLKKKETIARAKNLFINPTMQHRQTILSTVENQPLPSTSNNLYSPRLVEVTPSETRRLLAPYSPAFRHPTPPPMAKRGPWKTRRRLLSKISLHAGQARPSLSRGIVERGWRGYEGGRREGDTGWEGYGVLNRVEDGERWERRNGATGEGGKEGVGAAVGKDYEINMYVGGCGPRGSGVASNRRLLIGQRPPQGHAHSHTRCLKAPTKRQPPYIPWWTATAKAEGRWGWLLPVDARCQHSLHTPNTVTEFGRIIENWKPTRLYLRLPFILLFVAFLQDGGKMRKDNVPLPSSRWYDSIKSMPR